MSDAAPELPTLSQLQNSDYSYFGQLAGYLERISPKAQNALEQLAEHVKRPGGVTWEGEAADAAIAQAESDVMKARPFMWSWSDVAVSARRWQDELEAGTRTALDAVDDAERDGFQVGDDYSVTDTREAETLTEYNERQEEAQAHSGFIRHQVGTLVGNESRINGELKAMTAGWGTLSCPESGGGGAQPVDGHWKQDGGRGNGLPPDDPKLFHDWWQSLSPQQKNQVYSRDHDIGNHPGMPWDPPDHLGKDHYNQLRLPELEQKNSSRH
ncbi:MAG: hypothetical protein J2P17_13950 [Mycobacterium sp.]|nr:hypothetical protein [Mycobacterium sp.]